MLVNAVVLLACAAVIYLACEYFVNGIEWVGRGLKVGATATGTVLAAFGTALPETAVTFVAVVLGHNAAEKDVGVGAAIGGPLVLATLSYALVGAVCLSRHGPQGELAADTSKLGRDQTWFLLIFASTLALGLVDFAAKKWFGAVLFAAYARYVWREMRNDRRSDDAQERLGSLKIRPRDPNPPLGWSLAQTATALLFIAIASKLFVGQLHDIGRGLGLAPQLVALLLSPIATELPEMLNAVIWVRQGREQLALANISGAMMIQATLPAGLGLMFTAWRLDRTSIIAGIVSIISMVWLRLLFRRGTVRGRTLILVGLMYAVFAAASIITG